MTPVSDPRAVRQEELRCDWKSVPEKGRGVYRCSQCGLWTANLPLYRNDVCEAKDRRKGPRDRRHHV